MNKIFSEYNLSKHATILPFGSGLIHKTWIVEDEEKKYILQKINSEIFKHPWQIEQNIRSIASYLNKNHPGYLFVTPIETKDGKQMLEDATGFYRLFPFVKNSVSHDKVESTGLAEEASRQFSLFTKNLSGFRATDLFITLPDFHNLSMRYEQFEYALVNGDKQRIKESSGVIQWLKEQKNITDHYNEIVHSKEFVQRVTHHDTKISNVLFDKKDEGLCVIDIDTVMPGYFISDVGDMMRSYLSPANEEEKEFSNIIIRDEYFTSIVSGYWKEMSQELHPYEAAHFVYSGRFIIYMQALRFLTDHLNLDSYYGASYEGHNFIRAMNQVTLLRKYQEKESSSQKIAGAITGVRQI